MKKVMFDSNAFDKLIEAGGELNFARQNSHEYEYYITPIQVEELAEIPDEKKEKRIGNFLRLCSMGAILIPVPAVTGMARVGFAKVMGEDEIATFRKLSNGSTAHFKDDIIGTAAEQIGCIVITNDRKFINRLNNNDITTMAFEEWLASIKN